MAMPDAVDALLALAARGSVEPRPVGLQHLAFNPSAEEVRELVLAGFPGCRDQLRPDLKRQAIVDSWPADVDDSAAGATGDFAPRFDLERAFDEYLMPNIRQRYRN